MQNQPQGTIIDLLPNVDLSKQITKMEVTLHPTGFPELGGVERNHELEMRLHF